MANEQRSSFIMTSGDVFTVSVSGDIASFVTWKERLCSTINNTVAPYALFADGQQRYVSFRIEMLPDKPAPSWLLVGTAAKKQSAWLSIIGPPLLRIYWLVVSDTDTIKWEVLKNRLESWLDVAVPSNNGEPTSRPVELATLVILHVEPQTQLGAIISINRAQQQLSEKIRALNSANSTRNVHCFSFQPYNNKFELDPTACDRLATSLHSLLSIQVIERVRRIEEISRVERERCCRAAMAAAPLKGSADECLFFANMFLLEEAVARGYAALSLFDDALARLDMIDAVLSQSAANCFCQAGRPVAVWINECLAHPPTHVDCVRLVPAVDSDWPTSPCPLMLLENGKHPLIETRAELLSRQAAVIFRMACAAEAIPGRLTPSAASNRLATYAIQVAHSVLVESCQLSVGGHLPKIGQSKSVTDAFIFLLFCETAAACQVLASAYPYSQTTSHSPINLNLLGYHALRSLVRLARQSGFLSGSTNSVSDSDSLQATVSVLQLLHFRSPSSGSRSSTASINSGDAPSRPETHSDKLARLLTSSTCDGCVTALIELAESLLATLKSSGFRRWGRLVAFQLAEIYIQATRSGCKLSSSSLTMAEPLLLDCIGAWLSSRCPELAVAALKLLIENCYEVSTTTNEPQQLRRRAWALLHMKAYSSWKNDDEIADLSRRILLSKSSAALLSGNFLFTVSGINLTTVKNSFSTSVVLKLRSAFPISIEQQCSVELVVRMASVMRPQSFYGQRSFEMFDDDNTLGHSGHGTLPPFRPEAPAISETVDTNGSREHDEILFLKQDSILKIEPNRENSVTFKLKIPAIPDYEAGALIYFVRASVNLFDSAISLLCGVPVKSPKPMVFRPPEGAPKRSDSISNKSIQLEEKLCEISLADQVVTMTNGSSFNDTVDSLSSSSLTAAFGAEFSLEPVFVSGVTVIFVLVDIMQRGFVGDGNSKLPQLVDPVVAVELDGEDAVMLHRPIYDYSSSTSIVIPFIPSTDQEPPAWPTILARLTWRMPSLSPTVRQVRILLSCRINNGDLNDVESEKQLNVSSQAFDLAVLSSKSVANKLLPPTAASSPNTRETYM